MAMARTNIFLGQRRQRDDGAEFREADSPRRFDEILHDLFERPQVDNGRVATDGVFDRDMSGALSLRTWRR
jgi:hypothetical protein